MPRCALRRGIFLLRPPKRCSLDKGKSPGQPVGLGEVHPPSTPETFEASWDLIHMAVVEGEGPVPQERTVPAPALSAPQQAMAGSWDPLGEGQALAQQQFPAAGKNTSTGAGTNAGTDPGPLPDGTGSECACGADGTSAGPGAADGPLGGAGPCTILCSICGATPGAPYGTDADASPGTDPCSHLGSTNPAAGCGAAAHDGTGGLFTGIYAAGHGTATARTSTYAPTGTTCGAQGQAIGHGSTAKGAGFIGPSLVSIRVLFGV